MKKFAKVLGLIAAGFVALIILVVALAGGSDTVAPSAKAPIVTSQSAPAKSPVAAKPKLTASQEQAVRQAQSYLDLSGFSRKALIKQLEFEKYSKADATFAADYLKPNWKEEAAESAKSYLDLSPFSRAGLIKQLKFEGYTSAEAEYGVKAAGL